MALRGVCVHLGSAARGAGPRQDLQQGAGCVRKCDGRQISCDVCVGSAARGVGPRQDLLCREPGLREMTERETRVSV